MSEYSRSVDQRKLGSVRILVAAAKADGRIGHQEKELLDSFCTKSAISKESLAEVLDQYVGLSKDDLPTLVEEKKQLLIDVLRISVADGEFDPSERQFANRVASLLGLTNEQIDECRRKANLRKKRPAAPTAVHDSRGTAGAAAPRIVSEAGRPVSSAVPEFTWEERQQRRRLAFFGIWAASVTILFVSWVIVVKRSSDISTPTPTPVFQEPRQADWRVGLILLLLFLPTIRATINLCRAFLYWASNGEWYHRDVEDDAVGMFWFAVVAAVIVGGLQLF